MISNRRPTVLAYGVGVDSTAMLVELVSRGEQPDLVLTADTRVEKPLTYAYLDMIKPWMAAHGIHFELVTYETKRFKHWPPYRGLAEMALTNGTLPSKSLGGSSCSLKYKKAPQDAYLRTWQPAVDAWARGEKVVRLIGLDAGKQDSRRYAHAATIEDPLYEYQYPLRVWGWDRARCTERIREAGLPVPPKSSCFFCIGMTPEEVRELPRWCLRTIVLVEARAAPRLHTAEGLWRRGTKMRPGSMTAFIRHEGLLPGYEIDGIVRDAPTELIKFQDGAAQLPLAQRPTLTDWLTRFNAGARRAA